MKILVFGGGLGNQIFEYAFYLYLKSKYPQESFWGVYNKYKLSEHNGLEINKWFEAELPKSSFLASMITYLSYSLKLILKRTKLLDLHTRICLNESALIFNAYKYTKSYIPTGNWLNWKLKKEMLSGLNREILQQITDSNSFFIHVRRGDYQSEKYKKFFEGTCPISYYMKAINHVLSNEKEPHFFIFSDDIKWTKEKIKIKNSTFIDWNQGENSPIDMFLMSQCKGAILANSTFSYWGALLGTKKKVVYYPKKWINSVYGTPNIFFDEWISF